MRNFKTKLEVATRLPATVAESGGNRQVIAATTATLFRLLVKEEKNMDDEVETAQAATEVHGEVRARMAAILPVVGAHCAAARSGGEARVSGTARATRNVASRCFEKEFHHIVHYTRQQKPATAWSSLLGDPFKDADCIHAPVTPRGKVDFQKGRPTPTSKRPHIGRHKYSCMHVFAKLERL